MASETGPNAGGAADVDPQIEKDRALIVEARKKGLGATLKAFTKLSGPGWLQSAITLGGGSLASSLYLGVLGGFALLWLQPVAMIIGVIMLSAIAYVTLSTGERPFRAINQHVNPVLGWGWLIATLMANCVWSMPQFSLACGAFRQNLMPGVFAGVSDNVANGWIAGTIAVVCLIMVFFYDSGGWGVKFFNILLKLMVGIIVLSFFGVVVYLSLKGGEGGLEWGKIGAGLIPDFRLLWTPASTFDSALAAAGKFKGFWTDKIVSEQQDVLVAAAATAVGINMTFLLPYSMLKRGWNKDFRGLAGFDLSTGLFIPFILATGCVVIASASRFHTVPSVPFPAEQAAGGLCKAVRADTWAALDDKAKGEKIREILTKQYGPVLKVDEEKDEERKDVAKAFAQAAGALVRDETAQAAFGALAPDRQVARLQAVLEEAQEGKLVGPNPKLVAGYMKLALERMQEEKGKKEVEKIKKRLEAPEKALKAAEQTGDAGKIKAAKLALAEAQMDLVSALPLGDRRIASMLVRRDNIDLAQALSPLTGNVVADYVFGIGVVGMAVSSIIILMLINGFCICEMVDKPSRGWLYRVGCVLPAIGILGPFIWKGAKPYLAIPTSVFGFIVIPIAYTTFALLLNQRKLLGDNMPRGLGRWVWNLFMLVGALAVAIGSVYMAWKSTKGLPGFWGGGWVGIAAVGVFIAAVILVHFVRRAKAKQATT